MDHQLVIVLDFGGQYNQLIARRVRECGVYCEIKSYQTPLEELRTLSPAGIIFTGGPNSVYDERSPHIGREIFDMGIPILGICYGCQLLAAELGGEVTPAGEDTAREYGKTPTVYDTACPLSIQNMARRRRTMTVPVCCSAASTCRRRQRAG